MWDVSQAFLQACRTADRPRVTVAAVTGADGRQVSTLDVHDGDIGIDLEDAVRRDMHVVLADPTGSITPRNARDMLAPFGTEITIMSGWLIDGQSELVPMGVFRISADDIEDLGDGTTISITGLDRSAVVQQHSSTPLSIDADTNLAEVVRLLIRARYPEASFNPTAVGYVCPSLFYPADTDLWAEARTVAASGGLDVSFGPSGNCNLRPTPSIGVENPVVLRFSETDMPLWNVKRSQAGEDTPNGVIMIGNHSGLPAPVRGEAWITDLASPIRRDGPYGEHPVFLSSGSISSTDQATAAAQAELDVRVGNSDTVTFDTVPVASLADGDVIEVDRAVSGIEGRWLATRLTIPFGADQPMQVTARSRVEAVS